MKTESISRSRKAQAAFQTAFDAHRHGDFDIAERRYQEVLASAPNDMEACYLLGTAYSQRRKYPEAKASLERALAIDGRHPEALNNMGLTLRAMYKPEEAIGFFRRALAVRPEYADALNNLGNALEVVGQLDEAEDLLERALKLQPGSANIHYNLGLVCGAHGRFDDAARHFLNGIALKPDFAPAYNDVGGIYKTWGRLDRALECFDQALRLDPLAFNTFNNRGSLYEERGQFEAALADYEHATALNPADESARWNMALLFLRQGILDRGWDHHELRLRNGLVHDRFPYPNWDGGSLAGKTLLIFAEQGLGDEILFASCFADAIAAAAHCVIECDPRLVSLYARSFPTATIRGAKRLDINWILELPTIDVQIAAGSLPRFFRQSIAAFPATPGYLVADPVRVDFWRHQLRRAGSGLQVGICWRSGATSGERHKHYSQLAQWQKIFGVPQVHFVNLQYDDCSAELQDAMDRFGIRISGFSDLDLKNQIDETCALISGLDLVISAGTAVSEMASAVGVPVFRLDIMGKAMDSLGTDGSPWHPRLQIFRQETLGDWSTPLALVARSLQEKAAGASTAPVYVKCGSQVELAMAATPDDLATYVLREQGGWFEAEHAFVSQALKGPLRAVDIGSGIGIYTCAVAAADQHSVIWALTPDAGDADLLLKSRRHNGFDKRISVAVVDAGLSLDAEMSRSGLDDIALVRIALEMLSPSLFDNSGHFFTKNSPLVVFGIAPQEAFGGIAVDRLGALGYAFYKLLPGPGLLVPCGANDDLDAYALNLFACKADRALMLEREGVLIRAPHELTALPGIEHAYWQAHLEDLPFAAGLMAPWTGAAPRGPDWEVYWMALNLYAMATSGATAPAERVACLQTAASILSTLVQAWANLPRLLSLCRVLIELGHRETAVGLLNECCALLDAGMSNQLDEPCLPLDEDFAAMTPDGREPQWAVAMLLAQREMLRTFSTFFSGDESLATWDEIEAAGFGTAGSRRRAALIRARFPGAAPAPAAQPGKTQHLAPAPQAPIHSQ